VINHFNIQPIHDIYANLQRSSLGKVANQIQTILDEYRPKMAPESKIKMMGMVSDMQLAYFQLGLSFACAIILIYFVLVINFQSWLDPFIIITALLGAITGIFWILYLTNTDFSIPSLVGAIVTMGVATGNSILVSPLLTTHSLKEILFRSQPLSRNYPT